MKRPKQYRRWSRKLETNILRVYEASRTSEREDGMLWYSRANEFAHGLSECYNLTLSATCGVIAAISPGNNWGRNLLDAETLCREFVAGHRLPTIGSYGRRNIVKAEKIFRGANPLDVLPPTGPKVRAFYQCIFAPDTASAVCIDRHAKCLAIGAYEDREANATVRAGSQYQWYAWHYKRLAERLGLLPHQLQAITWVTWKRLVDEYEKSAMSFDFKD